jgi:plasmid maintenance system antidote protein VapI
VERAVLLADKTLPCPNKLSHILTNVVTFCHSLALKVTADAALDLAKALRTSAKLWMNLQATYDLDQARKRRNAT